MPEIEIKPGWLVAKGHIVEHFYNAAGSLCGIFGYPWETDDRPLRASVRCERCCRIADELNGFDAEIKNSGCYPELQPGVLRQKWLGGTDEMSVMPVSET